ncbi:MAG: ABC transporter ATP-binding protein [Candidatus Schekmanbacteria bacterium]|nr:ABC transporter ATP-binding protein [Candidatus Schekmanbacteria bacterium]
MRVDWLELHPLVERVRRYRRAVIIGLGAQLAATILTMLTPQVVRGGVDFLGAPGARAAGLLPFGLAIVALAVVSGVAKYYMRFEMIRMSRQVENDLRNDLFAHLAQLTPSFYDRVRVGDVMSRLTNDLGAVRMLLGPGIMYLTNTIMTVSVALILMATIHPLLLLWSLLPLVALSTMVRVFGRRVHARSLLVQQQSAVVSTIAQESLSGIRVIKAYVRQAERERVFGDESRRLARDNVKLVRLNGILWPALSFISGGALAGALYLGGRLVVSGAISVGGLVAFIHYLAMLTWPMIALGWVLNLIERGAAANRRLNDLLAIAPDVADAPEPPGAAPRARMAAPASPPSMELRDVTFYYPSGAMRGFEAAAGAAGRALATAGTGEPTGSERRAALENLSLLIPAGATVGVVGPTASGKSTLMQLLVRLHDPTRGAVLLAGTDLRSWPLADVRHLVVLVPQDVFLFSDSIANNIAFGAPDATRAEIERAAEIAALDTDLALFPRGLDTVIGERGVTLSGGQKARVAIARALVAKPKALLLDDCLRNLDTHTEERVLANIRDELRQLTAVVVSHRISSVRGADRIIVLRDGRIVETGGHEALLQARGTYWSLFRHQQLELELERAAATTEP